MLEKSGISVEGKKTVVLGGGGASATVEAVLRDFGAKEIIVVDLNKSNLEDLCHEVLYLVEPSIIKLQKLTTIILN